MADNMYLLETRLSREQQVALDLVREVARSNGLTVFLVGGAVRDLISGTAVRDLDVAVQGDALKLRAAFEAIGATVTGKSDLWQALFLTLPGGVRMEVSSTLSVTYPKPGKPLVAPATILEDLRRRDFTANAMALSLNEGSYGLLMDPLNGVADIENRQLRLVSNYGFIENPALILRAARFMGRLGWTLEEKTHTRYETSREENYIAALDPFHRGYETEELFYEEDPLRVMRRLEEEGWLAQLSPSLGSDKANHPELQRLRDVQSQLQVQGVVPNGAALSFPLLTAKLTADEVRGLKNSFPRKGFVHEIEALEASGKDFVAQLISRAAALPSQAYRLIRGASPEVVLWAAFYSRNASLQAKFKSFSTDWPQVRQRIPYTLLQEMRIFPELPGYEGLLEKLFFELMDGRLETPEAMKAFLEPYSPPAPPPPVSLRRPRAAKKESKASRSRKKTPVSDAEVDVAGDPVSDPAAQTSGELPPATVEKGTAEPGGSSVPEPVSQTQSIADEAGAPAVADVPLIGSEAVKATTRTPSKKGSPPVKAAKIPEVVAPERKPVVAARVAAKKQPVAQSVKALPAKHSKPKRSVKVSPPVKPAAKPAKRSAPAPSKAASVKPIRKAGPSVKAAPTRSASSKTQPSKHVSSKSAPVKKVVPSRKAAPAATPPKKKVLPAKKVLKPLRPAKKGAKSAPANRSR